MKKRIHILGASGSGTTTLAEAFSKATGFKHLDTDNYYWHSTPQPFTEKRSNEARKDLIKKELEQTSDWVLSGSLCGWGDDFIPEFDLVVFLSLPKEIRMKRLIEREKERYGSAIEVGGSHHQASCAFIEWASNYDEAGLGMRSRALHEAWLSKVPCPVLKIEGDKTVEERLAIILANL